MSKSNTASIAATLIIFILIFKLYNCTYYRNKPQGKRGNYSYYYVGLY